MSDVTDNLSALLDISDLDLGCKPVRIKTVNHSSGLDETQIWFNRVLQNILDEITKDVYKEKIQDSIVNPVFSKIMVYLRPFLISLITLLFLTVVFNVVILTYLIILT